MRIERVDDNTVKCYLSNEEMAEFEITYKDFLTRTKKAREVVEQIIVQAMEEVGYKPPEFAMDMQIMMMPEKGMILTLSEKLPDEISNNPGLLEYLREMKRIFKEHNITEDMSPEKLQESLEQLLSGEHLPEPPGGGSFRGVLGALDKAGVKPAPEKEELAGESQFAVFAFASLRAVYDYIKVLPRNLRVNSILYVKEGVYYLYMDKGGAAYKRYSRACIQAMEYGELYCASLDKLMYLQEHAECLIEEKAIQKLRL